MNLSIYCIIGTAVASIAFGQAAAPTRNPFPQPLEATQGVITVQFAEFASLPDLPGQAQPARMMLLVNEPGTRRLFVNDMRGPLYTVSYDGKTVTPYLDVNAADWGIGVQSQGAERGFPSSNKVTPIHCCYPMSPRSAALSTGRKLSLNLRVS